MDILRFITAGSVDDGKSTLIGRLLYDSKNILIDQLEALEKQSKNKNENGVDLAILTDGLRAEREQGITIDVAYRYFSTPKRKFIIADAPGHIQYTRNMITGASNSQLIVILIDARQGVIEQTRRHSIIASLLKMKNVVVAINKMDLVDYSEEIFNDIKAQYELVAKKLKLENVNYFPISAFNGDNIVSKSEKTDWYQGSTLLDFLENVEINENQEKENPRFQVQYVIRPQTDELHDYRGYAGEVISGIYRKGDEITVLPQNIQIKISKIETGGQEVDLVFTNQPAVIHVEDDIDISRGDFLVKTNQQPKVENELEAVVCWLDKKELNEGNKYFIQHKSKTLKAIIKEIEYKIDVNTLEQTPITESIKLNEVVKVRLRTASPLVFDSFEESKSTGNAILIDETSNSTVGAVMIL
ncbi:sulfate adenylyltransferase subunit 1 [Chryseobacterium balustinum]|uniref:sulfate adenylyltransferase n=1 Tax=Chryseobacterium balustinum TaxID=246 RepID=A0AAX2IPX9_9FLAO|nr:GTP-binding protein [Chryseobacterium balustinum]AZB30007.1 GTP-binding protein [Chryseobacterium balustinum]SKC04970.1 sulfate adenylyltransferase subunit 1 [Chryseobacterium balustinum]SQA91704.1 Bifunctional enzyme CysN/CysC [Chryseobacterium balustinum]